MNSRSMGWVVLALVAGGCNCGQNGGGYGAGNGGNGGSSDSGGGSGSGTGGSSGFGGSSGTGGGNTLSDGGCGLRATLRDFKSGIPKDFENSSQGTDKGIVQTMLGVDFKPVYAPATSSPTTTGKANFDKWYRDVPGTNLTFSILLPLSSPDGGLFVFDSTAFFPLDDAGFGNEGNPHNFHFTTEIHATFTYRGGEQFSFRGDDDVFIFVNKRLAIDLGGIHSAQSATINFDQQAAALGIVVGNTYPFDAFHAERHTTQSNFHIDTSVACFVDVQIN